MSADMRQVRAEEFPETYAVKAQQPGVTEAFSAMREALDECAAVFDMLRDQRSGLVSDISAVLLPESPNGDGMARGVLAVPEGSALAVSLWTFAGDLRSHAEAIRAEAALVGHVRSRVNL